MEDYKYLKLFADSVEKLNNRQNPKAEINENQPDKDMEVSFNVGGKVFVTRQQTLTRIPGSLLSELNEISEFYNSDKQEYSFDRSPSMFKEILGAHRTGQLHAPRGVCPTRFKQELQYWRVPIHLLMPCCWKYFHENTGDLETLNNILQSRNQPASINTVDISKAAENQIQKAIAKDLNKNTHDDINLSLRYKIWLLLEEPSSSTAAKIWCFIYILLVLGSVVIFILWLDTDFRVEPYLYTIDPSDFDLQKIMSYGEKIIAIAILDPHPAIFVLECVFTSIFSLESILLLFVCPTRLSLLKSPYYIIKVTVCLAMLFGFIFDIRRDLLTNEVLGKTYAFLKGLSVFRLLLVFRVQKIYTGLQVVLLSIEKSCKELLLLVFVFVVTVVIYGGMIYCVELDTSSYPNIKTSFWWALITMTTVGYGDFYPTSTTGYVVAAVCALQGLIVIALPIAAIASVFASYYARSSDLDAHIETIKSEQEKLSQSNHTGINTVNNVDKHND